MASNLIRRPGMSDRRVVPTYAISEASGYLSVPASTLRWWFCGQSERRNRKGYEPIFQGADQDAGLLSFFNLVEAHILSSLQIEYTAMRTNSVRRALDSVRRKSPEKAHPLVTENFYTDGKALFQKELENQDAKDALIVNATLGGQTVLSVMDESLKLINYESGFAFKLFPKRGNRVIVLNPRVSAGRPTVSGAGVLASIIRQRAYAGEPEEDLARDYSLTLREIQEAIKFSDAA